MDTSNDWLQQAIKSQNVFLKKEKLAKGHEEMTQSKHKETR